MSAANRRIGFYISKKKQGQINWPAFTQICRERQVDLVEVDEVTVFKTESLDAIVLRLTDEIANLADESKRKIVEGFRNYLARNPSLQVIDPLGGQTQVVSRLLMANIFEKLSQQVPAASFAKSIATKLSDPAIRGRLEGFPFPVSAPSFRLQTTQASGSTSSHLLTIAWDIGSLLAFEDARRDEEFVVQEYINHDATLFKIYVLRGSVFTVSRASLRNLPRPEPGVSPLPIQFDSQKYKETFPEDLTADDAGRALPPNEKDVKAISESLSSLLGLTMFGFDMIRNSENGKYVVVDVNYFPDYRGVSNFHDLLFTHLTTPL